MILEGNNRHGATEVQSCLFGFLVVDPQEVKTGAPQPCDKLSLLEAPHLFTCQAHYTVLRRYHLTQRRGLLLIRANLYFYCNFFRKMLIFSWAMFFVSSFIVNHVSEEVNLSSLLSMVKNILVMNCPF